MGLAGDEATVVDSRGREGKQVGAHIEARGGLGGAGAVQGDADRRSAMADPVGGETKKATTVRHPG